MPSGRIPACLTIWLTSTGGSPPPMNRRATIADGGRFFKDACLTQFGRAATGRRPPGSQVSIGCQEGEDGFVPGEPPDLDL